MVLCKVGVKAILIVNALQLSDHGHHAGFTSLTVQHDCVWLASSMPFSFIALIFWTGANVTLSFWPTTILPQREKFAIIMPVTAIWKSLTSLRDTSSRTRTCWWYWADTFAEVHGGSTGEPKEMTSTRYSKIFNVKKKVISGYWISIPKKEPSRQNFTALIWTKSVMMKSQLFRFQTWNLSFKNNYMGSLHASQARKAPFTQISGESLPIFEHTEEGVIFLENGRLTSTGPNQ